MNEEQYSAIWSSTFARTMDITEENAIASNGLSVATSDLYAQAASLSDDQIWQLIQKGEL